MTKLLDSFFVGGHELFSGFFDNMSAESFPRFNVIYVNDKEYEVDVALPGWSKENVKVHFDSGILTVEGVKQDIPSITYIHRGISGKAFKRSFLVPKSLEVSEAQFKDGLLKIIFKSRAQDQAKFIEVK